MMAQYNKLLRDIREGVQTTLAVRVKSVKHNYFTGKDEIVYETVIDDKRKK